VTQQYARAISCLIGGAEIPFQDSSQALEFNQFRITFHVRRGDYQNPNSCDLRIYNLKDDTANRIQNEFTTIVLSAGYPGNIGVIFQGTIRQVRKGRINQLDSYVDVTALDSDEAYNFSTMALTLAAGQTAPANVVESFVKEMAGNAVQQGYVPQFPGNALPRGRVFYGYVRDECRAFAQSQQCSWNLNDGRLSFIPLTSYAPGSSIPLINPTTGLIGVPERTVNGVTLRTLLNPNVKVGSLIRLDTTNINLNRYGTDNPSLATTFGLALSIKAPADGLYYVLTANHTGDTRGNDWYSDLLCLSVDSSIPPSPALRDALTPASPPLGAVRLY
jgi:hypothetical protein